jgi:ATPase family associated with various cellular activities (AAA)
MPTIEVNKLALKPSQLLKLAVKMIGANLPLLVVGAPGVGKTDVIKQAVAIVNATTPCDLLITHPVVKDPTAYGGMPWITQHDGIALADFIPFGDLRQMMNATRKLVVFIDDGGHASSAVQATLMQLVLAREIDGKRISDHVTFIMASNRRGDRAGVTGILEPLKSRFKTIVELVPDLNDWIRWAVSAGLPAQVIAYLRLCPDQLLQFVPTSDMTNSPNPRTWHNLADMVALDLPRELRMTTYCGSVGEGCGSQFAAFEDTWQKMPSPDAVLLNPKSAPIPAEPSTLWALTTALAHRVTKDSMQRYCTYLERLLTNYEEFAARSMQAAVTRDPNLTNTPAYITAMAGSLGKLMIGD